MGCGLCRLSTADKVVSIDGKPQPSSESIVCTRAGGSECGLTIIHFNDVYNIEERQKEPVGGASRFKTRVDSLRELRPLVLFSGDALNPSISKPKCPPRPLLRREVLLLLLPSLPPLPAQ